MSFDFGRLRGHDNLQRVVSEVLLAWPEHADYCNARFRDDPPGFLKRSDELAELVLKLTGNELQIYCADYKWMCEQFLEEEIFFRREGRYRLSSFDDAYREVYSDKDYMRRYIHGILISQFVWTPHARAFDFFRTDFLPRIPKGSFHLEIGPGHGLFLYFAWQSPQIDKLEAWDVSESSIEATQKAIETLGAKERVTLKCQDVLVAPPREAVFGSAIISEVLEHLEEPQRALKTLHRSLKPGGFLFVNVPINSPAPDHLYLLRSPQEAKDLVEAAGFTIVATELLPVTGISLERALKQDLSISCIMIAQRARA